MKKLIFIAVPILLLIFYPMVKAKSLCESNIDTLIDNIQEAFITSLADSLKNVAKNKNKIFYDLRVADCEMQKLCRTLDYAEWYDADTINMTAEKKAEKVKTFDVPSACTKVYEAGDEKLNYKVADFEGPAALCIVSDRDINSEYMALKEYCNKQTSLTRNLSLAYTSRYTSYATKQEVANFYSAKILHLTVRLKALGVSLDDVNNKLKDVYRSAVCSCSK